MNRRDTNLFHRGRHAGLLLPLFSATGVESWGIGEIGDLPALAAWLRDAGLDFLQVLPLNEMAAGQRSPYSAISAMAIDPIFISPRNVPEFVEAGGERTLPDTLRDELALVRAAPRLEYDRIRPLKHTVLRAAFERFVEQQWKADAPRGQQLREFMVRERWWVDDYALFRALRDRYEARAWWDWDPALARRDPKALEAARRALEREVLFYTYLQWVADEQWSRAHRDCGPVGIFGDLPFMVGSDSADVWSHQHAFRLDATVGAPPDAFSETGQDWGLPVYRWDVCAAEDDAWLRARARRNAGVFDGYRVDHLVGFYRTYVIPGEEGAECVFVPPDEPLQLAQGERLMRIFLESGARIIAEDLGTVPDFVRESLDRLGIPGYKVLRWERDWDETGEPFRDPVEYKRTSVATTGTHDTETLTEWWESAPSEERRRIAEIPFLRDRALSIADGRLDAATRDALLEMLAASPAEILILPIQDIFGWRDRVNVPATVSDENWSWRLPWAVEQLTTQPEAIERARTVRSWMERYGRSAQLFDATVGKAVRNPQL